MSQLIAPLAPGRFAALVWTLAQSELRAQFKGTVLGWLWSLIVPLATLGLYALVFGLIFRAEVNPLGNGDDPIYAVWLFVGLIAFNFFSGGLVRGADSLRQLGGVLNRVRLPALAPVAAGIVVVGVQSLVELALYLGVLAALTNIGWSWLLVPFWLALLFAFTAGLAAALAILATHFHDVPHALSVLLRFLFFTTPVMYPLSMVPADLDPLGVSVRGMIGANPLAHFIEMGRTLLYDLDAGGVGEWFYLLVAAAISVGIGAWAVARFGHDTAERLQ